MGTGWLCGLSMCNILFCVNSRFRDLFLLFSRIMNKDGVYKLGLKIQFNEGCKAHFVYKVKI